MMVFLISERRTIICQNKDADQLSSCTTDQHFKDNNEPSHEKQS